MSDAENQKRFTRIEQFIGKEAMDRLQRSYAAVIGLGAIGSYATEALARAGVGRLLLADADVVEAGNFNRQLYALEPNLGRPKAEIAVERVQQINPACRVKGLRRFVHKEDYPVLFDERPDIIIDAIDSLNPKVELLIYAGEMELDVICCLGAAMRTDPSKIRVDRFKKAQYCPLARQIRRRLRRQGVGMDFPCVFSLEELTEEMRKTLGEYDNSIDVGRPRRILGSLPTIPGIFGLTAANAAIQMLIGRGPSWFSGGFNASTENDRTLQRGLS
jgi:tRNA A37 threonylcarbamoyladenosine dehydratase